MTKRDYMPKERAARKIAATRHSMTIFRATRDEYLMPGKMLYAYADMRDGREADALGAIA